MKDKYICIKEHKAATVESKYCFISKENNPIWGSLYLDGDIPFDIDYPEQIKNIKNGMSGKISYITDENTGNTYLSIKFKKRFRVFYKNIEEVNKYYSCRRIKLQKIIDSISVCDTIFKSGRKCPGKIENGICIICGEKINK